MLSISSQIGRQLHLVSRSKLELKRFQCQAKVDKVRQSVGGVEKTDIRWASFKMVTIGQPEPKTRAWPQDQS